MSYPSLAIAAFSLVVIAVIVALLLGRRRHAQRRGSLQHLLDLADRLEADLKTCGAGLRRAHALMSLNPDLPAASEQEAHTAIEAGLRALLQQRLWIRDHSPSARQPELNDAAVSMRNARDRLQPLLKALSQAQHDVNSAMREHLRPESDA